MAQHSGTAPKIKPKKCIGCGTCAEHCAGEAITLVDGKALIDPENCTGCGECFIVCETGAVRIKHNRSIPAFMENLVEYAMGVLQNKQDRALFVNFLTGISPGCDCMPFNDRPITPDIGIIAATDPVAADQASVDLVNGQEGVRGSSLPDRIAPGQDKFKALYPKIDWAFQLDYAQRIGLGRRDYELVSI